MTSTVVYLPAKDVFRQLIVIAVVVTILIAIQAYSNFYISNYGHVMGAKIEYDMRAEIFAHYQKLSFSFYDDQKVGQLMSRVTSDLFDITELLHHRTGKFDNFFYKNNRGSYYSLYNKSTTYNCSIYSGTVYDLLCLLF